jgi:hypothetical protein
LLNFLYLIPSDLEFCFGFKAHILDLGEIRRIFLFYFIMLSLCIRLNLIQSFLITLFYVADLVLKFLVDILLLINAVLVVLRV